MSAETRSCARAQRVIQPAVGHLDELLDDRLVLAEVLRLTKSVGALSSARERLSGLVSIAMILLAFRAAQPWITARPTQPTERVSRVRETTRRTAEDGRRVALLDIGRLGRSAVAGRDAAAEQAGLVKRRLLVDLDDAVLADDSVLREGAALRDLSAVWGRRARTPMKCRMSGPSQPWPAELRRTLALALEARGLVRHQALALRLANGAAEVRLARLAELALCERSATTSGGTTDACTRRCRAATSQRPSDGARARTGMT